jgi:hypothetical protein
MEANYANVLSRDSRCFSGEGEMAVTNKMKNVRILYEEFVVKQNSFFFSDEPTYLEILEKAFELMQKRPGSVAALFLDGKYNCNV